MLPTKGGFRLVLLALTLTLTLASVPSLRAVDGDSDQIECLKSAALLAPIDSPDYRKYAPDRDVDITHLALDVTPDFKARTVTGKALLKFKVNARPVQELHLDGVNLAVKSVNSTEAVRAWQATENALIVTFSNPVAAGKQFEVTIEYSAEPQAGLYFRTPEMGYKEGDTHLFSQGEEIEARNWYPCIDSPNMKFTSEITCHVPDGMTVISNGRLLSQDNDANGLTSFHWSQEKPHANYLISLVAGYFKKLEEKHKNVPLAFYTPPSEFDEAKNSFADTKDIMAFFEEEIGVPYPWDKYDQVCVNDFVAGGMENTSCTTLTDSTLHSAATENIRSSESLISHEMAHQWFGDLVTCKDWSHIWLNEGFATFYETLYDGHKNGRDSMLYELYGRMTQITGIPNDTNAIVRRNYDEPREMFGYQAYPKGSWVLHSLRSQLGEDMYRRCIKTYLERHRYGSVITDDLRKVMEELTGRSFDQFFDQWVYHAHHPELDVTYSWDDTASLAKLTIRQSQKVSENVLLFNLPVTIRFKGKFGTIDKSIQVREKEEDFYFPLDSAPEIVRIDPEFTFLCRMNFHVSNAMLYAQLADREDVIGRLYAIEQLRDRKDREAIAKLKGVLNDDPFYGARIEAARALRTMHSDEALEALLASTSQSDARVRREVAQDLAAFYQDNAYQSALAALQRERNPDIIAALIRGVGGYSKPEVHDRLLGFLQMPSFQNELAEAAIGAMRSQDDPGFIQPIVDTLKKDQSAFTSRGFGQGLGAVAYLARNEEKKTAVREFLTSYVNSRKRSVQRAALSGLGTLGDPQALPVLQRFAEAAKDSPERAAAERAVTDLRAGRRPVDDFKNLRQEVLDLEKANRDLRKELDSLKRKVEAAPRGSTTPAASQKGKRPGKTTLAPPKTP
jgi:aminopeptidase N